MLHFRNLVNIAIVDAFTDSKLLYQFSRTDLSVNNLLIVDLEIFDSNSRRSAVIFPISSGFLCFDTLTL